MKSTVNDLDTHVPGTSPSSNDVYPTPTPISQP